MGLFFTSDLHISHRAVAYQRRYGEWPADKSAVTPEDVAWHNDMLAANWDATVCSGDVVWVLGDLVANNRSLPEALTWIEQRPGVKHLIAGNHDSCHPMHRDAHKHQKAYWLFFESVQMAARRKIEGQTVLLSHFPYSGDNEEEEKDRDVQWRLRNHGLPLLHGHVHSMEKITWTEGWQNHNYISVPQVHVGPDAWSYTPVALETIAEILADPVAFQREEFDII